MYGTLYYCGGSRSAFAEDLIPVINANTQGLVVCFTQRDANELFRFCPQEKCMFVSLYEVDQKAIGRDLCWVFVPLGYLDDAVLFRIKNRLRVPGFVDSTGTETKVVT